MDHVEEDISVAAKVWIEAELAKTSRFLKQYGMENDPRRRVDPYLAFYAGARWRMALDEQRRKEREQREAVR